jgi:hypothetical protein
MQVVKTMLLVLVEANQKSKAANTAKVKNAKTVKKALVADLSVAA